MLCLDSVSKTFPDFSLKSVSFTVEKGDYFILLGESGAGKSIVLETIAGLVIPDSGTITLEKKEIANEKIQHRGIGLVFQDHAVFPHLTVAENISYSLHGMPLTKKEKQIKINHIAIELGIEDLLLRYPSTLSGGELQRVALGRSLVQNPLILLLDEPLSSLDSKLKSELRRLLRKIHACGQTILHVTHDYEEALSLGTKIAVIQDGRIVQVGSPSEVFHQPVNEFVANFIGIRNFFRATLATVNRVTFAHINENIAIRIVSESTEGEGFILIRGEDIFLSVEPVDTSATNNFEGRIVEIIPTRGGLDVIVDIGIELHALVTHESVEHFELTAGKTCRLHFKATAVRFINN
ncbi:MAG: ABC transporter ATP-binding protein [Bacteroidota bacterium]